MPSKRRQVYPAAITSAVLNITIRSGFPKENNLSSRTQALPYNAVFPLFVDSRTLRRGPMAKMPKKARSKPAKKQSAALDNVSEYRHEEATRKNNPPAKIAAEGVVPLMPKIKYEYSRSEER